MARITRTFGNGLIAEIRVFPDRPSNPFKISLQSNDGKVVWSVNNSKGHQDGLITGALKKSLDFSDVAWVLDTVASWPDDSRCVYLQ